MTMNGMGKAAVMNRVNAPLDLVKFPLPEVERGCILTKILCCTICGSDLHSWLGHRSAPMPIILGHEIVGEIVELGEDIERDSGGKPLKVGDRITWCLHLKKYGHDSCADPPHLVGGFAEYCYITPGTCVIKVPDNLTNEEVAPANCALATVVAGWEEISLKPFENVLIQGAGTLGFYAAALAKHYGCNKIMVTDILDNRLKMIESFGATDTINVRDMRDEEVVETVRDLTHGFGVDVAMEVAGIPEIIPTGLKCLRTGGRYVEHGSVSPGVTFTYDASDIMYRRLTIKGVHNYDTKHLQWGVTFLSQTKEIFPFHQLVTHTFSLDEINQAMEVGRSREGIRVAIKP
jgi:2-desacetyl-2-hydroxyethyl bacteriochlorophyllide A dehydrogenase